MNFCWLFVDGPSFYYKTGLFNELEYSIKSVQKYFKGARCVVFGDDPKLDVEYVPVERISITDGTIDVRHVDIMRKIEKMCEMFDDFVLMYDDIYFLRNIKPSDLKKYYALKRIDNLDTYVRKGGILYTRLWRNTYKKVSELMVTPVDWETHMPRYYRSDRVKYLIEKYDLHNNNLLLTSLYPSIFADWYVDLSEDDTIRSHVDQVGPNTDFDKEFSRKFLIIDDNACTGEMISRIKKLVE